MRSGAGAEAIAATGEPIRARRSATAAEVADEEPVTAQ